MEAARVTELQQIIIRAGEQRQPGVLVTLVQVQGSSYRRVGARLFISAFGETLGSISGGCLEEDIIARALRVADTGKAELAIYDTTSENDLVWGVGLGCHGTVHVLLERVDPTAEWLVTGMWLRNGIACEVDVVWDASAGEPLGTRLAPEGGAPPGPGIFRQSLPIPPRLFIFGAGNDAQPFSRLAHKLGWRVCVADPRPAYANEKRFPEAHMICDYALEKLVTQASPSPTDFAVVMTHHYLHDLPILRDLLALPLAYLGLLGPRKRAERILSDLAAQGYGITPEMRARLYAPAGLDLGADGPQEVALSILAEMQAVVAGREGRSLRTLTGPIHR